MTKNDKYKKFGINKTRNMAINYSGPERRQGRELRIDIFRDESYHNTILREAFLEIYSNPNFFEYFGKRNRLPEHQRGIPGRHFIPRKGEEPADLDSSGLLTFPRFGRGMEYHESGQVKTNLDMITNYDSSVEKYSRKIFPDRRKTI